MEVIEITIVTLVILTYCITMHRLNIHYGVIINKYIHNYRITMHRLSIHYGVTINYRITMHKLNIHYGVINKDFRITMH